MNTKRWLGISVAAAMLFCGAAAHSGTDKTLKKAKKPEKTCEQKCGEQHKKDVGACKLKKAKDADKCKKAAQTKKDKCGAGCKK